MSKLAEFRKLSSVCAVGLSLWWPSSVAAQPEEPSPDPALSPEEREKLKAEIKAELAAERKAEREEERRKEREAEEKRKVEEAAAKAAEEAAKNAADVAARTAEAAKKAEAAKQAELAKKTAAEDDNNSLVPAGQDEALGKHSVKLDKSTYKPGSGLHFESEDKEFALTTRLRAQLRQEITWFDGDAGTELEQVFQIRRARLQFKGHAFGEHNKFKVEFAFSPRDLGVRDGVVHNTPLLTWYFEFDHLRDLTVRAGQYKIPFSRQRVVSSGDLQLVDRSIANGEFNRDRDIGLDIRSTDIGGLGGYLRYYAGVYMGEGRDFGDRNATPDFKLHYLARFEVLPMGDFKDYKEADIERTPTPKLSLGATYAFQHEAQRLRGTTGSVADDEGTTNYHAIVADYMFKWAGFSSTAEFFWRTGKRKAGDAMIEDPLDASSTIPAPVTAPRNGYGVHVQAGYLLPRTRFEIAARYSGVRAIGDEDPGDLVDTVGFTSLGRSDSLGGGLSYYFAGHPWKIQGDYFHIWKNGDLADGEDRVRVQLQLAF